MSSSAAALRVAVALAALRQALGLSPAALASPAWRNLGAAGSHAKAQLEFDAFVVSHARSYIKGSSEYEERFKNFLRVRANVEAFNKRPDRLWTAGVTKHADRTPEELQHLFGWKGTAPDRVAPGSTMFEELDKRRYHHARALPKEISYADRYNSYIRDQGPCGSCWALTAATVLSYHSELWSSNRSFATQEFVSCVPNPHNCGGSGGCEGATVELAMQYAMMKGVGEDEAFPYTGATGTCQTKISNHDSSALTGFSMHPTLHRSKESFGGRKFGMVGWEKLPSNKYHPLMEALYERGPVGVTMAANHLTYYIYGIYDCSVPAVWFRSSFDWIVNHAVTLIGYGTDEKQGKDFWLIQNSWGSDWGERGRVRVLRRENEETWCGDDTKPRDGVACDSDKETSVRVCGTCGILFDSVVPHFGLARP